MYPSPYRYRHINTGTGHFCKFGITSIPVPSTSEVPYHINTGTGHFGKFGMKSLPIPETSVNPARYGYRYRRYRYRIPVPDTSVSSVHQYRYMTLGKFGTTTIPVPDTSVSSVRHPYRYRAYWCRTKHTLEMNMCTCCIRTHNILLYLWHPHIVSQKANK